MLSEEEKQKILNQPAEVTKASIKADFKQYKASEIKVLIWFYYILRLVVNKYFIFVFLAIPQIIALNYVYEPGGSTWIFGFALLTHFGLYLFVIGGFSTKSIDLKHKYITDNIKGLKELVKEKKQQKKDQPKSASF